MSKSISRLICVGLFLSSTLLCAQSKSDLQKKKKKLLNEIEYTNSLLNETQKSKKTTVDLLVKLDKKISSREELISTINEEIRLLEIQIEENKEIIQSLEQDLQELKDEYAKMLYYTYKNKNSYTRLMFVFSSNTFNEAYKRMKYLRQYTEYRRNQAELILKTRNTISKKIDDLNVTREQKQRLLKSKELEKNYLAHEKSEKVVVISDLKKKETELKREIKRKQRTAEKTQKAIEELIRAEILAARKRTNDKSSSFPLTPEAKKLSESFAYNKGKLPWPVEQGFISEKYGEHPHPAFKNVTINNHGINISTSKGALARAVFDGVVSKVLIIPSEGKSVMIRHGEYFSVYQYMSEVFVKAGDKVKTKQELGVLINDVENAKTDMHFELWKGLNTLNPEYWIFVK